MVLDANWSHDGMMIAAGNNKSIVLLDIRYYHSMTLWWDDWKYYTLMVITIIAVSSFDKVPILLLSWAYCALLYLNRYKIFEIYLCF